MLPRSSGANSPLSSAALSSSSIWWWALIPMIADLHSSAASVLRQELAHALEEDLEGFGFDGRGPRFESGVVERSIDDRA
jgi:hypothetical protein